MVSIGALWTGGGDFNGIAAVFHQIPGRWANIEDLIKTVGRFESRVLERTDELAKANRILQMEIDKYRQAELSVNESEGKDGTWWITSNWEFYKHPRGQRRFLEVNKAMEKITGYCRDDLLGMDVRHLFANETQKDLLNEAAISDWKTTLIGLKEERRQRDSRSGNRGNYKI